MQMEEVSLDTFNSLSSGDDSIGFTNKVHYHVYRFYKEFKDQRKTYKVVPPMNVDFDRSKIYERFGIHFKDAVVIDEEAREYVVIIDPLKGSANLENHVQEFVNQYLPEDAVPTFFVIDKVLESYEEFAFWVERVREVFPQIYPLADYSHLVLQKSREQDISGMVAEAALLGYSHYMIDDLIESIAKEFRQVNSLTLNLVKRAEEVILEEYKKSTNLILMYSGPRENEGIVSCFCAYMFYKHKINSHLYPTLTLTYLGNVSYLLFDRARMLAEDQINFLRNLPDVACKFSPDLALAYGVYLETGAMDCRVRVAYADYDNLDSASVERATMRIKDIALIPLDYEVGISVRNLSSFRENHDKFLEALIKFEAICESPKLLNVTNVFFMEINGKKKIAHIEEITLDLPAVLYPLNKELVKTKVNLTLEDISTLYPVNVLGGYKNAFGPFILEVQNAYKKAVGTSKGLKVKFYEHNHALGLIIHHFNNSGPKLLNIQEVKDFITLGLWWEETYRFRTSLASRISKYMDVKKSRHYSKFFSIFGGPFPLFGEELVLREEFLKEW